MTTPKIQNSQLESGGGSGGGDDATTEAVSYYADGTSGSDSNDGLTALTPKKTLQAVFDLIPFHVRHNVDVNLEGTFSVNTAVLEKHVDDGVYLNVDGGSDVTTLSGPYTATATSANSITTGTSVTNYTLNHKWLKMTSGTNNGYIRGITVNVSNAFYFCDEDMGSNNIGDTFIIVKPTTNLTAGSSIKVACSGGGSVVIQRLYLNSGNKIWSEWCEAKIILSLLMAEDYSGGESYIFENCKVVHFYDSLYSSGSFDNSIISAGVSDIDSHLYQSTSLKNVDDVEMRGVRISYISFQKCGIGWIFKGSRFVKRINITDCVSTALSADGYAYSFISSSGYTSTQLYYAGGNPDGLFIYNSDIGIYNFTVSNGSGNGVTVERSNVIIKDSGLTGTGQSSFGIYVHTGSTVFLTSTTMPSIAGSSGDITMNGSSEQSTWAGVNSAGYASNTNEMSIVRKFY